MLSWVLSKLIRLLIIGTPFLDLYIVVLRFFRFPWLWCQPSFLFSFFPFVFHHWDAILGSIHVCSFGFQSLECHPMLYLGLVDYFFCFSSLWRHRSFYLCSFLVPSIQTLGFHPTLCIGSLLVPSIFNHWEVIRSSIYGCSFVPLVSHHWDPILGSIYCSL